jgi:hypothetical protein
MAQLHDAGYRHALRYQYAWEMTDKDYLLIAHNDVLFCADVVPDMLDQIGSYIIIGEVGQCWNCPAARTNLVELCGVNGQITCRPEDYAAFTLDFAALNRLYKEAHNRKEHIRPFLPRWSLEIKRQPWPLPECRVNEWCCMVNMKLARPATLPRGRARPFGAFVSAGCHNMDTSVAWFRDVHMQGYRAKHFPLNGYLRHTAGTDSMFDKYKYESKEKQAAEIIRFDYPDFVRTVQANGFNVF